MSEFSCLYLPQGTLWLWSTDEYGKKWFWAKVHLKTLYIHKLVFDCNCVAFINACFVPNLGRGSGQRYTRTSSANVYAASVRDGLIPLNSPDAGSNCLVALVIWPGEDYHFLRLDIDGTWSQKSGRSRARNTDDSGNRILDPRSADRGPYTVFAGWLGVGPGVTLV